ncbi:MAG: DNA ligase-associated DEXH box helicase, partial [Methylovirgula sp.]
IIEVPALNVRYVRHGKGPVARGGPELGKIEEAFLETLVYGDTFLFAGKVLRFEGIRENECFVSNAPGKDAKVPYYGGGKFPLSTYLAARVRELIAHPREWRNLPPAVAEWLDLQMRRSALPPPEHLLVETFPRGSKFHLVAYPFEGRLAHQTLGMLLTRRMERAGLKPLGFVANDYALGVWGGADIGEALARRRVKLDDLFSEDMLGDDLEAWLQESSLMKRSFRNCAIVAGMIERNFPGREKTGRQIAISTDLIYDVLRRHEPAHILLRATRADAAMGLLDLPRLAAMLARVRGRLLYKALDRVSPLAVPVLLEIGREPIYGEARETILAEAAAALVEEAAAPARSAR